MSDGSIPLVSIVVPTYNRAHCLSRLLRSVQRQTWKNWEVLVVDNNSCDGTDEVVKPWLCSRVRLLKIQNDGIIAASRNLGIREAQGDWIAFLDSDDWWTEDKLQASMRAALAGADVVFHDLTLIGESRKAQFWKRSRSRTLIEPVFQDLLRNGNALPNSSVIVRKNKLNAIGGLREDKDLVSQEDFDCWLRLAQTNCNFVRISGSFGYYWIGSGTISNPRRTLNNIDIFLERYKEHLKSAPWWCYYSRAIAYSALGDADLSEKNIFEAWHANSDLEGKLRILIRWIRIKCSHILI